MTLVCETVGLGRFGDRRLQKGGPCCRRRWPSGLDRASAGWREAIVRDAQGGIERHFVILCFAARWVAGEPKLNEELDDARWLDPAEISALRTTEGLADIVAAASKRLAATA